MEVRCNSFDGCYKWIDGDRLTRSCAAAGVHCIVEGVQRGTAVKSTLTWLHISDIHFQPKTEWRDSAARKELLSYLKSAFENDESLRPDLVFCTGDIAFGETGSSPLDDQYNQAKTF